MNQRKIGVILSYTSQAIAILTGLLYTPVMLRLLGQSEFGLYQLVYSVVSYLSILSMGFASSYMRFYSRAKKWDDKEEIARLNGMFMLVFLVIAMICLLCGIVMIINIRAIFGNGLTDSEYRTAKVLMAFMVLNLALTFPNSVFDAFSSAHERFFFQKLLHVLQHLLNPFLTLPLLIMGYGSIGMVCITTFLTLAKLVVNMWFSFKKLHVKFTFQGLRFGLLKEMWIFTFFIFLNQIIDQINWNVDKFLLGRVAGTGAVAIYGLGAQINTMYMNFSTSVSNVFVPKVNNIVMTTNNNEELTKLFTKVGRIQFVIMSLILSGFVIFGEPFMLFWGGAGCEEAYYVAMITMTAVTVALIQNLGIEIQRAKNKHQTRSIVYLCIAIANIGISIPLIKWLGIVGAALGTAITLIAGTVIFMNIYYHCKIGLDMRYFWKQIISFLPSLVLPCIAGILIKIFVEINSITALLIWILIYASIYCICMYFIGLNEQEKQMIKGPIHKLIKR